MRSPLPSPSVASNPGARRRGVRAVALTAALLFGAGLTACGGDDDTSAGAGADVTDGSSSASENKESAMSKPTVEVPEGPAPTSLVVEDLVVGSGAEAVAGRTVAVHYVGVNHADGSQFDASWDRGEPLTFPLGAGMVIPGWDQGVEGMKVGGRRMLVIPPDLAYGAAGYPPVIKPNATLVFVVDLVDVS